MDIDEFEILGRVYRAGPLDARKQLHIVRRLGPLLAAFGGAKELQERGIGGALSNMGDGFEALAKLPDADVDYVLDNCLRVVSFKIDGDRGWQRLMSASDRLMIDDLDLAAMFMIVKHVIQQNLAGFFRSLQLLQGEKTEPEVQPS